jgi:hypothetical protein
VSSFAPQRPIGIAIVAILEAIAGIFSVSVGLLLSGRGASQAAKLGPDGGAFGAIILLIGVLSIVMCYGVWMRKRWAWTYAVMVAALGILTNVTAAYYYSSTFSILAAGLQVLVIYYLTRSSVKAFFPKLYPAPSK